MHPRAHAPHQEKSLQWEACMPQLERGLYWPQLEKAHMQQRRRPCTAKNKLINQLNLYKKSLATTTKRDIIYSIHRKKWKVLDCCVSHNILTSPFYYTKKHYWQTRKKVTQEMRSELSSTYILSSSKLE